MRGLMNCIFLLRDFKNDFILWIRNYSHIWSYKRLIDIIKDLKGNHNL